MSESKLISIVTPCYNEEESVREVVTRVKEVYSQIDGYEFEHIFIDNCSTDNTVSILKDLAKDDKHLKLIVNERNFGHIRSPYYGLLQANGEAVILVVCDLQDPPEMINDFIKEWEKGIPVAIGVKTTSSENSIMYALRTLYYKTLDRFSDVNLIENFTGFGLYDKKVIEELKLINEPYPYLRGLIAELGFQRVEIPFHQPVRKGGKTKNNWFTLYDMAMLGFVNHSKAPLRMATLVGLITAVISFLIALVYLVYKIIYWDRFPVGTAPLTIGLFFISSVQLIFLGIIGEYVGANLTNSKQRPLVIERERVNF